MEELAAANALFLNLKKENVLRRIMNDEEQRVQNNRQRTCFKKKRFAQRLDSVDLHVNGQWIAVTEPSQITNAIIQANDEKYSSTNNTPLIYGQYLRDFVYLGEKHGTDQVLNGTYEFPSNATNGEIAMLLSLTALNDVSLLPTTITPDEYKQA